ncbi:LPXTG cell wall anchor domain-containing protein [Austwickia sp. TVS 96-490-7B]
MTAAAPRSPATASWAILAGLATCTTLIGGLTWWLRRRRRHP